MKKILVIEDNIHIRENTAEILELEGYEVLSADNGKNGVEKALAEKPDLILCDIMMPIMDGYGVLYLLGKNKNTVDIPFIFLTARVGKSAISNAHVLGATNYLIKPFSDVELLDAVKLGLKKSRATDVAPSCTAERLRMFVASAQNDFKLQFSPEILSQIKLHRHEKLFREGDNPEGAFFVVNGKIKSFLQNEEGNEFVTNSHNAGDFLGYLAILEDTAHKDNAMADEDSTLLIIPKGDFLLLAYSDQNLSHRFVNLLTGDDMQKQDRLLSLIYFFSRRRVIDRLLAAHEKIKSCDSKYQISAFGQSVSEFDQIGHEYISKILGDLKADDLIDIQKERIVIKEESELKRMLSLEL